MDSNPPTAADYAWADARRAQEQASFSIKRMLKLEKRVCKLEKQVKKLQKGK